MKKLTELSDDVLATVPVAELRVAYRALLDHHIEETTLLLARAQVKEARVAATTWEADHQREALERHGLMELYMGCDSIDMVCTALLHARARLARAQAVLRAARALRDSGYDGPFLGDPVEELFTALAVLERES